MAQFQDIARRLLAAGYANHPDGKGVYLLSVDPTERSLISSRWSGDSCRDKELIATSVRPNSTASYLINPDIQLVVCISSESTVRVLQYNDDEEEWADIQKPRHVIHQVGNITASFGADNTLRIIFQDNSGRLVYLHKNSNPQVLVDAVKGSPLSSALLDDIFYVFYISATDNCIHYLKELPQGRWDDGRLAKHAFDQIPRQFIVFADQKRFEAYVLTKDNTLQHIANSKMSILGKVDQTGKFTSTRTVDLCCNNAWDGSLTTDLLTSYLVSDSTILDTPGGENSVTPLAGACWQGHLDVVKLLLHGGANPNALSPQKRTPLFYLTKRSPNRNRLGIARALLDAGANVDECYPENNSDTPLMNAIAVIGDKEVVQELLKRGASLTATNLHGQTAKMLTKGTKMETDFMKWTEKTPSELETRLVEFIVSLLVLIITYTNNESIRKIFDQVITEVMSRLDEIDGIDN